MKRYLTIIGKVMAIVFGVALSAGSIYAQGLSIPGVGNPSPAMINQFNQLPTDQKKAVLDKVAGAGSAGGGTQNITTPPTDMTPKPSPNEGKPSAIELQYTSIGRNEPYSPKLDSGVTSSVSPKLDSGVTSSVSEALALPQQYGYSFFTNNPGVPSAYVNTPTNPDYILGPGDGLLIRVWGKIEEQFSVTIDNNGQIFLPKVGVVNVGGVSYGRVGSVIKSELSKFYVNFQVSVSIGSMRSIKVFVLGEVKRPGAYDVPAKGTLMAALYGAGGPLKSGSMRQVQLIRNKRVVKTVDLYQYLMSGNQTQDPMLLSFDTVFIPLIGDTVKVDGEVKRPGIYEVNGEETIFDAVQNLGGGVGISFYQKRIQVERVIKGQKRVIVDVTVTDPSRYSATLKGEKLSNGDVVTVLPILDRRYNEISIQGNVMRPGVFEFAPGLTLGELIKRADGLLADTYLKRIEIFRWKSPTEKEIVSIDYSKPDSTKFKLSEFDIVQVASTLDIEGKKQVSVAGEVDSPGDFQLLKGMKVLDLVYLSKPKPTVDWSYADLVRSDDNGGQTIVPVNLEELRQNPLAPGNFSLKDKDRLFLRVDVQKDAIRMVDIGGQVRFPGRYIVKQGDRITDVIARAGGLATKAYLPGLVFKRQAVKERQEESRQYIAKEENRRLFFDPVRIKSLESAQYRELYAEAIKSGQLVSNTIIETGRIIVDISSLDTVAPEYNIELNDKDEIYIPEVPTSILVSGGVQNPGAQVYMSGQTVGAYIQRSGGFNKYAVKSDVFVIRASGKVVRDGGLGIPIDPGDSIYVQEEIKVPFDWIGSTFEFTKFMVNVLTTVVLLNRL